MGDSDGLGGGVLENVLGDACFKAGDDGWRYAMCQKTKVSLTACRDD